MGKVEFCEFIPPIYYRVKKFLVRKVRLWKGENFRRAPFEFLPESFKPVWILDVGANVGDVTVSALLSFPEAKVICFEPVGETFQILKKHLSGFEDRVCLYNMALSDKNDTGLINITTTNGANSIEAQANFHRELNPHVKEVSREKISLVKLDDIAKKFPTRKIDILKIDIEGHELSMLNGGDDFISNNVDFLIIEVSFMRDVSVKEQAIFKIFSKMDKMGFCLINIFDLHRSEEVGVRLVQMDCVFRNLKFF